MLDVDAWRDLLDSGNGNGSKAAVPFQLAAIDLKSAELHLLGRSFHDVQLRYAQRCALALALPRGARTAELGWQRGRAHCRHLAYRHSGWGQTVAALDSGQPGCDAGTAGRRSGHRQFPFARHGAGRSARRRRKSRGCLAGQAGSKKRCGATYRRGALAPEPHGARDGTNFKFDAGRRKLLGRWVARRRAARHGILDGDATWAGSLDWICRLFRPAQIEAKRTVQEPNRRRPTVGRAVPAIPAAPHHT
jgi:hypothetical protein